MKYQELFSALCSCGESSFGAMLRESAGLALACHSADPVGNHFPRSGCHGALDRAMESLICGGIIADEPGARPVESAPVMETNDR